MQPYTLNNYGQAEIKLRIRRCRGCVSFTVRSPYVQKKGHLYQSDRKAGGPQSRLAVAANTTHRAQRKETKSFR
jgi:hypothetical protein